MAGGCKGWCVKNPPTKTADLYDPATDTWTALPDLPFPIHSGKMTEINGKPTIIGGVILEDATKGVDQSNYMVSYDYESNQWNVDGKIQLPRSSHAIIQIPKTQIPSCFNT